MEFLHRSPPRNLYEVELGLRGDLALEVGLGVLVDRLLVAEQGSGGEGNLVPSLGNAAPLNVVKPWVLHQLVAILFSPQSVCVVLLEQTIDKVDHLQRHPR